MKWWLENVYEPIKPKISEFFTTIALIEKSLGIEIYKPFSEPQFESISTASETVK